MRALASRRSVSQAVDESADQLSEPLNERVFATFFVRARLAVVFAAMTFASGFTVATAQANGGGLVGNGAGVGQHNVIYAYQLVPSAIEACLATEGCVQSERDRRLLNDIARIASRRQATADFIRFLVGTERNERGLPLFETDPSPSHMYSSHRFVVSFGPGLPVLWNSSQLHLPDGSVSPVASDVANLVAFWIHELGHQALEQDHVYLDGLGSRVRVRMRQRSFDLPFEDMVSPSISIVMTGISYARDQSRASLFLRDGRQLIDLSAKIQEVGEQACSASGATMIGWDISNPHWREGLRREANPPGRLPFEPRTTILFGAWVDVRCRRGGVITRPRVEARLLLTFLSHAETSGPVLRFESASIPQAR